jgi:hypothetical protein
MSTTNAKSESQIDEEIKLEAAVQFRSHLWRNNVGALFDAMKRMVRYGLANDSATINEKLKSGDRIGITPVVITQDMVGKTIGVFTSIEVKKEGWTYKATEREKAQQAWIDLIKNCGGIADFANSKQRYINVVKEWYDTITIKKT